MKQNLIIAVLLIIASSAFSQNLKFGAELNYLNPFDHNFISQNYDGLVDIGLKYRITNSKRINFGISMNAGFLKTKSSPANVPQNISITAYEMQPKIFTEFNFSKVHPFLGIGYTSFIFKSSSDSRSIYPYHPVYHVDGFSLNNTQSGIDLNIGFKYNFLKNNFLQIQYDYIMLGVEEPIINSKYNCDVNTLKIGIGMDF